MNPTPEALSAALRTMAEKYCPPSPRTGAPHPIGAVLTGAADLLEAQQRQLAVARRLLTAVEADLKHSREAFGETVEEFLTACAETQVVVYREAREAREAGLAEGGDRDRISD